MPFTIVRQDITKMKVDAIVNAANTELLMGGGVCGAIFNATGAKELQEACDKKSPIKTGDAVITPGFKLPAKFVIHAAGPVYNHNNKGKSAALLSSAYINSLRLAVENKCESIAFPLISSGIYGYPKDEALQVATTAITKFIGENDIDVYLAVFDKTAFQVSEELMGEVASYIDEHYIDAHDFRRRKLLDVEKESILEANAPVFGAMSDARPPAFDILILSKRNRRYFTMKKNFTELIFILDKSGSMSGLENDTIGGFNSMLENQKAVDGECRITTVLFDNSHTLLHDRIDIHAVSPMTNTEYFVGGSTALLDAIGLTINNLVSVQRNTAEDYRADKVMFVIITDGEENSSREYSADKVHSMIEHEKEKYGWEFIFLGANIDAVQTAQRFGIDADRAVDYIPDAKGTQLNFEAMAETVACYRMTGAVPAEPMEEIRKDMKKRGGRK